MKKDKLILYDTMTWNTKFFVEKVSQMYDKNNLSEKYGKLYIQDINVYSKDIIRKCYINYYYLDVHFVTYTIGQGEIPKTTLDFLEYKDTFKNIKSISSTGQKNWGESIYAVAVDKINELYPNIKKGLKIELQGNLLDIKKYISMIVRMSNDG